MSLPPIDHDRYKSWPNADGDFPSPFDDTLILRIAGDGDRATSTLLNLLALGADPNCRTAYESVVDKIVRSDHRRNLQILLDAGAHVSTQVPLVPWWRHCVSVTKQTVSVLCFSRALKSHDRCVMGWTADPDRDEACRSELLGRIHTEPVSNLLPYILPCFREHNHMKLTVFEKMAASNDGTPELTTAAKMFFILNHVMVDHLKDGDQKELYESLLLNVISNRTVYVDDRARRLTIVRLVVNAPRDVLGILDGYVTTEPRMFAIYEWKQATTAADSAAGAAGAVGVAVVAGVAGAAGPAATAGADCVNARSAKRKRFM